MSLSASARWLVIATFIVLDAAGLRLYAMWLAAAEFHRLLMVVVFLAALAAFYRYVRPRERLVDLAHTAIQFLAVFAAAAVLSYIVVAANAPLADEALASADRAIGFDWLHWFTWVHSHSGVAIMLHAAYDSATVQLIGILLYLALTGQPDMNREFMWTIMLSLAVIIPISGLMPAVSAWVHYDVTDVIAAIHLPDFTALRDGQMHELRLTRMEGLITFPSFHTTLGVLFVYVLRRHRIVFVPAVLLNGVMILAVPSEGGHYLVDVVAGAAVAIAAIWATAWIESRLGRRAAALAAAE